MNERTQNDRIVGPSFRHSKRFHSEIPEGQTRSGDIQTSQEDFLASAMRYGALVKRTLSFAKIAGSY